MIIFVAPIILGLISLWHGGTGPDVPKAVKNILWGTALGGATWFLLSTSLGLGWPIITLSLLAGLLCLAGKATGHGRGLGLHEPLSGMPEVLEVLTARLIPYIPSYWYKVIILSVSGFLAVGGSVLALLCVSPLSGLAIAIGGLLKGPGYMFGQWLEDQFQISKHGVFSNQIGEFLAGFFAGTGLVFAYIIT